MTILPKNSVNGNPNSRPRTPPNVDSSEDFQGVSNSDSVSVWGPISTTVASGWTSSVSAVWSQSGTSSRESEKRSASSSQTFAFDDDCGPSSSKRRYRHSSMSCSSFRPRNCGIKTVSSNVMPPLSPSPPLASTSNEGYNSEDEYSHLGVQLTEEEWVEKDKKFERCMKKKGYVIKKIKEDGNCLFRSVAELIFGDEEMHMVVRNQCMDYISQNGDYFSQYVTEDLSNYVERKRFLGVQGNHLEIQAFSEMYNRPIHIYCYSSEPINIFQNINKTDQVNAPIRLCYHRNVHYNCLVDPIRPTIGVGLGLPNYISVSQERKLVDQAVEASVESEVEKAMLEDKIKATDWEATNEIIEEQVARESYLQWLRDCERRNASYQNATNSSTTTTSTVTSGDLLSNSLKPQFSSSSGHISPNAGPSSKYTHNSNSPKAGCSSDRDSPKPCSSRQNCRNSGSHISENLNTLNTEDFCSQLTEEFFGFHEWRETDVLTKVMVDSQKEYLESLKNKQEQKEDSSQKDNLES